MKLQGLRLVSGQQGGARKLHLHYGLLAASVGASGLPGVVYLLQQVSAMEDGWQSELQCRVLRGLSYTLGPREDESHPVSLADTFRLCRFLELGQQMR